MAALGFRGCVVLYDGTSIPLSQKPAKDVPACHSAYPADLTHNTVVPAYKSNVRGADIEDFNTCVAHAQVVNEHTIGLLKNRWGSLKELRTQLVDEASMDSMLKWITACVTLHIMIIEFHDDWSDSDDSSSDDEDDIDIDDDWSDEDPFTFRKQVKQRTTANGREPGGILWLRSQQCQL
ncbi:unnamed protein product [Phytophthora lilii]|uniref:Unnamed protein product n=1 Tax=Phytophthora lilii TaxID=2077276 RepID=A0A9W6TAB5_9STRA|nr:unnamed protein product [Phytophthora lilii]